MNIAGRKGYFRRKMPDSKKIKDGKEVFIPGSWSRIYGQVAPEGDDVYVPVLERQGIVTMMKFRDITLNAKSCRIIDLPAQKISFFRKDPDKDISRPQDQEKRIIPGRVVKHSARIGMEIGAVYIPIITEAGDRVPLRFQRFIFADQTIGEK